MSVSNFIREECFVIRLTRLNGQGLAVNSDLIKFIENAPDTVLTLISGEKIIVRETTDQVVERIIAFRRSVLAGLPSITHDLNAAAAAFTRGETEHSIDQPAGSQSRG